ncbi:hypothetical protein FDP41_007540 [Naegleria fowleri]|uniref:C2 domain-containing protein n=1 Tax=Naegleria fowleri TaxID=5763 RepID=A0A6A5C1R1_NAEFO|nr:uncharacterized protein FDP41_007540 [Naegleria fowleri]KAF0984363.1 hypothetical protein FDP41_007540 [Naegleria fowleri]CAG4715329.1 unnamed protein product [Naegleria fowleri]
MFQSASSPSPCPPTLNINKRLSVTSPTSPEIEGSSTDASLMIESVNKMAQQVTDTLLVRLIGAVDLVPMDKNGLSDPYTIVSFANMNNNSLESWFTAKTSIKKKTLNPNWNETFNISLTEQWMKSIPSPNTKSPTSPPTVTPSLSTQFDPAANLFSTSYLSFKVMDWDKFSSDDEEGDYVLKLNSIPDFSDASVSMKLNHAEHGVLNVGFKLKCTPRPSLNEMVLVKPVKRADFVRSTRNSWLTGSVIYPLSPWELVPEMHRVWEKAQEDLIDMLDSHNSVTDNDNSSNSNSSGRVSRRFSLRRNSKNLTQKLSTVLAGENFPKWKEERSNSSSTVTLSTDAEYYFMGNPSIVDRVFVQLLVGCHENQIFQDILNGLERDLKIINVKYNDEGMQQVRSNIRKEDENSRKNFLVMSIVADLDIRDAVAKLDGKIPKSLHTQYPSKVNVEGSIYVLDIGCHAKLLYVYISNCGKPNIVPFVELVGNSIPSSSSTLFESLYLDLDDSLWVKCPYGWEHHESGEKTNSYLISPIQKRAFEEGKSFCIDRFAMKKLDVLVPEVTEPILSNMSQAKLDSVMNSHNKCEIKKPVERRVFTNSSKKEIVTFMFELEYDLRDDSTATVNRVTHIEALINTTGSCVWSLSYLSNLDSGYRGLFETIISEIKTAEY